MCSTVKLRFWRFLAFELPPVVVVVEQGHIVRSPAIPEQGVPYIHPFEVFMIINHSHNCPREKNPVINPPLLSIQLLESPIPTTTPTPTSQKVLISREPSVVA